MLNIKQLELGPLANFIYIVADSVAKEAIVIDPAWDTEEILETVKKATWHLVAIALTHHHFDHVGGLGEILKTASVPVYIHKQDAPPLKREFGHCLKELDDGDKIALGSHEILYLNTPGHTEGSSCLELGGNLFTGDTLFIGGCGRVDLPNSDPKKMYSSLKKIANLNEATLIYPGHNYGAKKTATLGDEMRENPYLSLVLKGSLEDFLRLIG